MDERELYRMARRRVQRKAKFYKHFYIYVTVVAIMFILTLFRGRPYAFLPVAFFWGIGLIFHYFKVFGIPGSGVLSEEWEEREMQKEYKRLQRLLGKRQDPGAEPLTEEEELELRELQKRYDDSELV
ncbi:MAG: hypothetical protein KatS3mg029_0718 [Saprospiraceae bacterium]|nr:MAG: hypothetical protein KatS3mg029_0718 [Saprospiraceae bacterium]